MKHNWEYKRLGDVCTLKVGGDKPSDISEIRETDKTIPIYYNGIENEGLYGYCNCPTILEPAVTISGRGTLGVPFIRKEPFVPIVRLIVAITNELLSLEYLYYWVFHRKFSGNGVAIPQLTVPMIKNEAIPVPPLAVQQQIVAELDKINEVTADCRELLRKLDTLAQSLFYDYFSNCHEYVPLSYYVNALVRGKSLASKEVCKNKVLKSGAVTYDYFNKYSTKYLPLDYIPNSEHSVKVGDLIISRMNTAELVGACAYVFDVDEDVYFPDRLWRIEHKSTANPIFLWKSLIDESAKEQIRAKASGTSGSMKNISKPLLLSIRIKKFLSRSKSNSRGASRLSSRKRLPLRKQSRRCRRYSTAAWIIGLIKNSPQ